VLKPTAPAVSDVENYVDIVATLERAFGHINVGVYAEVSAKQVMPGRAHGVNCVLPCHSEQQPRNLFDAAHTLGCSA